MLSVTESSFLTSAINLNIRPDGRSRLDYRDRTLSTGTITNASGSARLTIEDPMYPTDVMVGVSCEIGDISIVQDLLDEEGLALGDAEEAQPQHSIIKSPNNKGKIVVHVECAPSPNLPAFNAQILNDEYTAIISRILSNPNSGIDLEKLVIVPNSKCWVLYIDCVVLSHGGDPIDALLMCIHAALSNTRIPKTNVVPLENGEFEFELSDDIMEASEVPGWRDMPVGVVICKVGSHMLLDPTPPEVTLSDFRLLVCSNRHGKIQSIHKLGLGGGGSVKASMIPDMIQACKRVAVGVVGDLHEFLGSSHEMSR